MGSAAQRQAGGALLPAAAARPSRGTGSALCSSLKHVAARSCAALVVLTVSDDLHAVGVSQAQAVGVRGAALPPHQRHERQAAVAQRALTAQVLRGEA